jgi:hypothetical protein
MEQPASSQMPGEIRGIVVTIPGNRRIPQALLRFFEFRNDGHKRSDGGPDWIIEKGTPVGSTVTNDRGEFALPYSAPKGEASLAFVVFGPETGGTCETLSWSCEPRPISSSSEAFLIGVHESLLITIRHKAEPEAIARLRKLSEHRRAGLKLGKPKSASDRLARLSWSKRASTDDIDTDHGSHIDANEGTEAARLLNRKLIRDAHKGGKAKVKAVPKPGNPRSPVNRKLQALNKPRLGLATVNVYSEVSDIIERLRPLLQLRRKEKAAQRANKEEVKNDQLTIRVAGAVAEATPRRHDRVVRALPTAARASMRPARKKDTRIKSTARKVKK